MWDSGHITEETDRNDPFGNFNVGTLFLFSSMFMCFSKRSWVPIPVLIVICEYMSRTHVWEKYKCQYILESLKSPQRDIMENGFLSGLNGAPAVKVKTICLFPAHIMSTHSQSRSEVGVSDHVIPTGKASEWWAIMLTRAYSFPFTGKRKQKVWVPCCHRQCDHPRGLTQQVLYPVSTCFAWGRKCGAEGDWRSGE